MKQLLAQLILDLLLKKTAYTRFNRIKDFILNKFRLLLVWMGDSLVFYDLFGTQLALLLSHNLPLIRKDFPYYSTNVGRIAKHVKGKYPSLKLVDIGANIGDTVAVLRYYASYPILCIEGSTEYFRILELNTIKLDDVYRSNSFVGNINGGVSATFILNQGTARLINGDSKIIVRKLGNILADFPGFENTKMIKVDTDGMDGVILRGAFDVIEKAHPVIFFEYDPFYFEQHGDDGLSLFTELKKIGYKIALIYDNYGDFMLSFLLDNIEMVEDLHLYCLGSKGAQYYDVCVFHEDDSDLAHTIRLNEVSFFYSIKRG